MPTLNPNETPDTGLIAEGRRIAHDLNNVFTGVLSQIELALIHETTIPAEVKENLLLAKTSAAHGVELVKELHTRCVALTRQVGLIDVEQLLEEIVVRFSRGIKYQPALRGTCHVRGDKKALSNALRALAEANAVADGDELLVRIDSVAFSTGGTQTGPGDEEFVQLSFQRPGSGAEQLSRQLFGDQPDQSATHLVAASRVISEHRGWIEVQGEMEESVRVLIYLPRVHRNAPELRPRAEKQPKHLEGKERLLLVDDDETVRMVVRSILSNRGYHVVEARDGEEAVRIFSENEKQFDLVLMDHQMPHLNGKEALKKIRLNRPDAKFIMLTGGLQDMDPQLRDVLFLQKPFENHELAKMVRLALDK